MPLEKSCASPLAGTTVAPFETSIVGTNAVKYSALAVSATMKVIVLASSLITLSPITKESTSATFLSKTKDVIFASLLSSPFRRVPEYVTFTACFTPPVKVASISRFRFKDPLLKTPVASTSAVNNSASTLVVPVNS